MASEKLRPDEQAWNRSAMADAMKQFLLIIISLGFTNAFAKLVPDLDGRPVPFRQVQFEDWLIFAVYILVGSRFLLVNWLYLNAAYGEKATRQLHIRADAFGVFFTGVAIGVQSVYVSSKTVGDFFLVFVIVLAVDVVSSIASEYWNSNLLRPIDIANDIYWIANNLVIAALVGFLLWFLPDSPWPCYILALVNCAASILITINGYFAIGAARWDAKSVARLAKV